MVDQKARQTVRRNRVAIDSPGRRRLPVLLRRAWYGLNQAFRRRLGPLALTPDQFTVMRTLGENSGLTQRGLTELMSSDPNTVAALLERMERAGLVGRQTHEKDRRANHLRLLPAGRKKFLQARQIAAALQEETLASLSSTERDAFLQSLEVVAASCQAALNRSREGAVAKTARRGRNIE